MPASGGNRPIPAAPRTKAALDSGLDVRVNSLSFSLDYGAGVFGPVPEFRRLDGIRPSLLDPTCDGPDPVYAIAMDVGRKEHQPDLHRRMLLFGIVVYASGRLGREPVRSQGHVHAIAPHCGWRTPELFEIWEGRAIVYAQEHTGDDPGRCVAIEAQVGDQIVVPPGWAHCVINADVNSRMVFGAWCDREYGFVYDEIRAHGGLAWFPLAGEGGAISWARNPRYRKSRLVCRSARSYPELGLASSVPVYQQYACKPESVQWVSDPSRFATLWPGFEP
jgi:glucose-6-phosphate isomerase